MPVWIAQALRALAAAGLVRAGFEAADNTFGDGQFGPQLPAIPTPGRIPFIPDVLERAVGIGGFTTRGHRRRRRRRALTASDKADIAFIAGILGKTAGANFAVSLAARPR